MLITSLDNFDKDVLDVSHQHPVLVDFWVDWCSPCRVIAPVLENVIKEMQGAISLVKLEVNEGENMKLARYCRVRGFPIIIFFKKLEAIAQFSGACSKTGMLRFLEEHTDLSLGG